MNDNKATQYTQLLSKLLIFFGIALLSGFIGTIIGVLAMIAITKTDPQSLQNSLDDFLLNPQNYYNGWLATMALQWFSALFTFVIGPIVFWKYIEKKSLSSFTESPISKPYLWIVIPILTITIMPLNEWINLLNHQIILPDSLKWMQEKEDVAAKMTKFLVDFKNIEEFIIGIVVIAGLAAVGEEITFRGIIQNLFYKSTQNHHIAIWTTAIIFSAIHIQFLGFFPRMFLGALFGYLYFWTQNLWIPIIAHFVNNGFVLVASYLYQSKIINTNPDNLQISPIQAVVSCFVSSCLIYWIYKYTNKETKIIY